MHVFRALFFQNRQNSKLNPLNNQQQHLMNSSAEPSSSSSTISSPHPLNYQIPHNDGHYSQSYQRNTPTSMYYQKPQTSIPPRSNTTTGGRNLHSPPGYSYPIDIQSNNTVSYYQKPASNHPPQPQPSSSHYTTPHQAGLPTSPNNQSGSPTSQHYSQPNQSAVPASHHYAQPHQSQPPVSYPYPHPASTQASFNHPLAPPGRPYTPTSSHPLQHQTPNQQHPQQSHLQYNSQSSDVPTNYPRDPNKKYAMLQFNGPIVGQEIDV